MIFGLLGVSDAVFAQGSSSNSSGNTLISNNHLFLNVQVLKRVDMEDIQEFMALPLEDKIFAIGAGLALIIFITWYTYMGKFMRLSLRIPIILAWILLILVPLYLLGNMLYFIVAFIAVVLVLITTWYHEHGRHMSKGRLIMAIGGVCLVLALMGGLPVYYYFTASENIADITVSSKEADLKIINYNAYRHTFTGTTVEFGGYVKNNGDKSAQFVEVNATGYDASGKIVSNQTTFVVDDTLLPGSYSEFGYLSNTYPGSLEDPQGKIVHIKLEVLPL